ncbi:NAD(P)H-dependent oxidoreductase [Phytobacter ursingii]|uniref:FMN-dependent NADH-azoreductase n=1 Tax=Phytobacter ursingii TaxID=1972431 RepID=UPI000CD0A4E6|nr:FMN-dependent NADH-azoreductase [Enterobacteriaceae bacterium ENNIH1]RDT53244.1 FMN-dependent NADH-azoreductase [Escherichia coli]
MKILHVDSGITLENSVSRQLSYEVVKALTEKGQCENIIYRDLVKDEIPHLTGDIAAGFRAVSDAVTTPELATEYDLSEKIVNEFLTSDIIVIGAPMYNFTVASQLKAWLDRLAQPGKTFHYTAHGPVGLATGKTVIVASARGGFYHNTPLSEMDFQEHYLRHFFAFLGITQVKCIRVEGASKGENIKQQEIVRALDTIPQLIDSITH